MIQGVSTFVTFGLVKAFVEAAVIDHLEGHDEDTKEQMAVLISSAAVGMIHTLLGRFVTTALNYYMGVHGYAPRANLSALDKELAEMLTVDLAVFTAFVAAYSARGYVINDEEFKNSPYVIATSKAIASLVGGLLQGAITDIMRNRMTNLYAPSYVKLNGDTIRSQLLDAAKQVTNQMNLWKDVIGKTAGSVAGGAFARNVVLHKGASAVAKGAVSMAEYLASWFSGIHAAAMGALAIKSVCGSSEVVPPTIADIDTDIDEILTGAGL